MVTKEAVEVYLDDVKNAIREKRYTVSSRDKNEQLLVDYVIDEEMREAIMLGLCVEDFCGCLRNEHPNFSHEILYLFGKDVQLLPRFGGEERTVSLYIKFNKLSDSCYIIISFHEQEKPLRYVFK